MQKNPRAKSVMMALAGGSLISLAASALPAYASMHCKPCMPKSSKMHRHHGKDHHYGASKGHHGKNPCAARHMDSKDHHGKNPCASRGMHGKGS